MQGMKCVDADITSATTVYTCLQLLFIPNLMEEYKAVLNKYAVFSGRARRREYWMFVLVNFIIMIGLSVVISIVASVLKLGSAASYLSQIYGLAVLLPSLAVGVRRLHDTGRSGWWLLIGVIPLIGSIVLLILMAKDSQPGDNAYGPNPKGVLAPLAPSKT